MITILNNTTWLKLRRFILLFSTLAIVWAQNDAGINITTEYVATTGEEDDLGPVVTSPDQTEYTEEELGMEPPEDAEIILDDKGYEWIDQGEDKWYRHGDSPWTKWET